METFHFRSETLAALRAGDFPEGGAEPVAPLGAWREAFPQAEPALVAGARRLFPATTPEEFRAWQGLRSGISGGEEAGEPIFRKRSRQRPLFPLEDPEVFQFRKRLESLRWVAEEVSLEKDPGDLARVSPEERQLLENTLGFFGVADELVMEGLDEVVGGLITLKEGRHYLCAQGDQECVHSEAYSLQIHEIIPPGRQAEIFGAVRENPAVARMADWVRWWIVAEHPGADFVALMAFLEGAIFSGFFATIQFFKTKNLFPGVTTLNEFICRDEMLHTRFWTFLLTSRLRARPAPAVVEGVARVTADLCRRFFEDSMPRGGVGINAGLLSEYTRFSANSVLAQAGYPPAFPEVENPLPFMQNLDLNEVGKSNFFEFSPTQYQGVGAGAAAGVSAAAAADLLGGVDF